MLFGYLFMDKLAKTLFPNRLLFSWVIRKPYPVIPVHCWVRFVCHVFDESVPMVQSPPSLVPAWAWVSFYSHYTCFSHFPYKRALIPPPQAPTPYKYFTCHRPYKGGLGDFSWSHGGALLCVSRSMLGGVRTQTQRDRPYLHCASSWTPMLSTGEKETTKWPFCLLWM